MPEDALTEEEQMLKEIQSGLGVDLDEEGAREIYDALSAEDKAVLKGDEAPDEPEKPKKPFSVKIGEKTFEADSQQALEEAVREGLASEPASTPGLSDEARRQLASTEPAAKDDQLGKFDLKEFAELFGDDPIKAYDYIDPHLPVRKAQKEALEGIKAEIVAREQEAFLDFADANPDFPLEDKDTIAFLEATTRGAKLKITRRNLKNAWDYMKQQKLATPKAVKAPKTEPAPEPEKPKAKAPEAPPRSKGRSPAPSTGAATGAATGSTDLASKFEQLIDKADDMDKLRAEMERLGLDMPGSVERFTGGASTGEMN